MKILITGRRGLSAALATVLQDHQLVIADRQNYNIQKVKSWVKEFTDFDVCINSAYDEWQQVTVLEEFYSLWHTDTKKTIINIGSNVASYSRTEVDKENEYLSYRLHKQALQLCFDKLVRTAKCDIKLVNPGPIDTSMINHLQCTKMSTVHVADRISWLMNQPDIKRLDLWL